MKNIFYPTILCFAISSITLFTVSCKSKDNTSPSPQINTYGAVAYFTFNGNSNDLSGNGLNAITVHGVTLAPGRNGDANSSYHFGGYNSGDPAYIDLPTLKSIDSTDEISISIWVKVDSTIPTGNSPFTLMPDNPADRLNAHIHYSPYTTYWDYGNIFGSGRVYTNIPNTYSWDHYVYINSVINNKMQVYKNNVLIIDKNQHGSITYKNRNIRLGGGAGGDQYFAGWMDDVRIFNRAITAATVDSLYHE